MHPYCLGTLNRINNYRFPLTPPDIYYILYTEVLNAEKTTLVY
jgi:hypothetical protein